MPPRRLLGPASATSAAALHGPGCSLSSHATYSSTAPPVRCDAIPRQTDTQKAESPRAHSPKEVRTGVNGRGVNRQGVNRQGVNGRIRSTQCSLYAPDGEIGGDFRKKCLLYEQILLYFIIQQKNIEDIRTIRQIPQFFHEKGKFLSADTGNITQFRAGIPRSSAHQNSPVFFQPFSILRKAPK